MRHNLEYKLYILTDRIYNQILCLSGSNGEVTVTVRPPILAAIEYGICADYEPSLPSSPSSLSGLEPVFQVPVFEVPVRERYYFDDPCNIKATGVSHDLLLLESLDPSLTEYLTSRTRSKNMYVDANTYHTQMAEFWLDRCLGPEGNDEMDLYVIYFTAS